MLPTSEHVVGMREPGSRGGRNGENVTGDERHAHGMRNVQCGTRLRCMPFGVHAPLVRGHDSCLMTHTVTQSHTRLARVVCGRARGAGTARGAILQYVFAHINIYHIRARRADSASGVAVRVC